MNLKKIIILIIFFCPLIVPGVFVKILEKPLITKQTAEKADVIIIHGGSTTKDNKLPLLAQQRLNKGLFLWRSDYSKNIIVSGGKTQFNNVEAEIMANSLMERGVPTSTILLETESTSTKENVANSLKLISEHGFQSALIVTSPYHSLRTKLVWKKHWPEGQIIITPADNKLSQSGVNPYLALYSVTREYVAIVWYKLNNWL